MSLAMLGTSLFAGVQREAFQRLDTDGDQQVSEAEFAALSGPESAKGAGSAAYRLLDASGDGALDLRELSSSRVFGKDTLKALLGVQETGIGDFVLSKADRDGDGGLSIDEYSAFAPDTVDYWGGHPLADGAKAVQFLYMDTDRDGVLGREELSAGFDGAMRMLRFEGAPGLVAAAVNRLDTDADGAVSAAELSAAPGAGEDTGAIARLFEQLDRGGDGLVTAEEMQAARDNRGVFGSIVLHKFGEPVDPQQLLLGRLLGATAAAITNDFLVELRARVDRTA
jgi:Ca2+-binding EF-hand superfamily protein